MKRHLAILVAAIAIVACSSDPSSATPSTTGVLASTPREALALDVASLARGLPPSLPAADPAPQVEPAAIPVKTGACDIVVEQTRSGIILKAVADLPRRTYGEYSLVITKIGKSCSSDINQGGPINGSRGRVELGSAEVSLEPGASYRATLKLTSDGHEMCRRMKRS